MGPTKPHSWGWGPGRAVSERLPVGSPAFTRETTPAAPVCLGCCVRRVPCPRCLSKREARLPDTGGGGLGTAGVGGALLICFRTRRSPPA